MSDFTEEEVQSYDDLIVIKYLENIALQLQADDTDTISWTRLPLVIDYLNNVVIILNEPPPPLLSHNVPFYEDVLLRLFNDQIDQEYHNVFGDLNVCVEMHDQEYGEHEANSGQNEDGQEYGNGNWDSDHEYFDNLADHLYIPHYDELDNGQYHPFDILSLEYDEEPSVDDEDYEYYTADDEELFDMFIQEQEEVLHQEEPVIPNLDFFEPQVAQPPIEEEIIDQQYIMGPYKMMDVSVSEPFNGDYAPAWLPPNGYIYPVMPMYEFVGPVMPMANGHLGYPDMAAPRHPMEMMYNNNLVPAVQPFVGPYYDFLGNEFQDMNHPGNDVPAPQDVFENEQVFNFGPMAGVRPEGPRFRAPGQIGRHMPVLTPPWPLPMIDMGPVFPAPISQFPGPVQVPRQVLNRPQIPVEYPGQGHVEAPGLDAAPEQAPYAAAAVRPVAALGG